MPLDLSEIATALLDAAPDAMFVIDDGTIIFVNDEAEHLFGYRREVMIGMAIDDLVPEDERPSHAALRQAYVDAPTRRRMGGFEVRARRGDGQQVWISVSLSPLAVDGHTLVIANARDVTEHRKLQERLRYVGTHDALTSLYNRGYFDEELARLARGRLAPISLIVLDVDNLKHTNDAGGHEAGDRLLQQVTAVLQSVFRAEDVIARIGGDEFAVVLPGVAEPDRHKAIARTRRAAFGAGVGLSIGGATATEPAGLKRALQQADRAMYADKDERRRTGSVRIRRISEGPEGAERG